MNSQHRKINSNPIAFLDSGIGGLPYLGWIKDKLPEEACIYLADRQNFPYGEKPAELVVTHVVNAVNLLLKVFSPKIVVIACNTASVLALSVLRDTFRIPFVGVVPAVKPAENLISSFARNCTVFPISAGPVINFVENSYLAATDAEKKEIIAPAMEVCSENGIDTLVLGCTHFIFLEDEFNKTAGTNMQIIDSREGVGNQIIRLLGEHGFTNKKSRTDMLFHTGSKEAAGGYSRFAERFGLEYKGTLKP